MNKNKIFLFLAIWMVFSNLFCSAQYQNNTAVFNIRTLGMNVGEIKVHQKIIGDELFVEAISNVEVWIIFKIKAMYLQTSIYKNGILIESSLKTYKNDAVNSETSLTEDGDGYILNKDQILTQVDEKIEYSGSLLYFNEPKDVANMYLEISGEKAAIEALGDHEYSIMNPRSGKKNEYNYKNGVLQNAVIRHNVANVYLERIEKTSDVSYSN
jgi:hypothetical protein